MSTEHSEPTSEITERAEQAPFVIVRDGFIAKLGENPQVLHYERSALRVRLDGQDERTHHLTMRPTEDGAYEVELESCRETGQIVTVIRRTVDSSGTHLIGGTFKRPSEDALEKFKEFGIGAIEVPTGEPYELEPQEAEPLLKAVQAMSPIRPLVSRCLRTLG